MVVSTVTAANVLKGGALLLSCCNRSPPLRSTLGIHSPFLHSLLRIRSSKIISIGGGGGLHWRSVPSFCTAADASSATAEQPSSLASPALPSDDLVKDAAKLLDIRVGRILRAWRHEEADSLYVEEVDVGEPEPRLICSGIVNYIPLDHLQDKKVVVLANLKPRNMRGVKSCGMLLAASDVSHENVELLVPPEGSLPGDRIWFGSEDEMGSQPDAATPNQIQKKKIWETVQPHLKTDASCVAVLGVHFMRTPAGFVGCTSLKNANIA